MPPSPKLTDIIGDFPYRITLAGGWIDQPFCSRLNPTPPGSVCVASIEPDFFWMERSGLATGTRKVTLKIWGHLPGGNVQERVEAPCQAENEGRDEPSGSQDMIGLLTPCISRLDYDFGYRGGVFPEAQMDGFPAPEPADIYAVNEDGDKPEKAAFCRQHGIQYAVLRRTPNSGARPALQHPPARLLTNHGILPLSSLSHEIRTDCRRRFRHPALAYEPGQPAKAIDPLHPREEPPSARL
jgi:hypothetical protein